MLRKLSLATALLALLMSVATRETWNGVTLGASVDEVRARLGTPEIDYDDGSARMLGYRDIVLVLREGCVTSISVRGGRAWLYARACLAFGAPASGGRRTARSGSSRRICASSSASPSATPTAVSAFSTWCKKATSA